MLTIMMLCACCRRQNLILDLILCYSPLAANSQRTSGGPLSDTEMRQWESETRHHAVDAVDALENH